MSLYLGGKLVAGATNTDGSSVRNLGEIVASTVPVVDAGLHLLDGSLINGNGIYSNFVKEIMKLYNENPDASCFAHAETLTRYNYGTVGNIINNDGVISNFLYNKNFALVDVPSNPTTSMELVLKVKQESLSYGSITYSNINAYGLILRVINTAGNVYVWAGDGWGIFRGYPTNIVLRPNTWTYIKMTWNGESYGFYQSEDGESWVEKLFVTWANVTNKSIDFKNFLNLGGSSWEWNPFVNGSIDLNECYLKIDGEFAWKGVTKIERTAEQVWQDSIVKYGMCDQFVCTPAIGGEPAMVRLPKYGNQLYSTLKTEAPVVGNGMSLGCTNGAYECGLEYISGGYVLACREGYGQYPQPTTNYSGGYNLGILGVTQDPRFSGLISNLAEIKTSSNCYYYIVVATSIKTDIEIDIGEITTDLDQKVDKDDLMEVQCIVDSYNDGYSWYRLWSDGWCEQGGLTTAATGTKSIALFKPYRDATYSISLGAVRYKAIWDSTHSAVFNVSNVGFDMYDWQIYGTYWSTAGYIEE